MSKNKYIVGMLLSLFCLSACSINVEEIEPDPEPVPEPTPESLISLFNKDSKLYINSLKIDSIAQLKTYHHKNYDDVPFVDFEEFHYAIRPFIEKPRAFNQIDDDNYVYSTVDNLGKMYFDTKNDVIKYINFNRFLDPIGNDNNGIYGDITSNNISLYKSSEKTKYITKGHDVTINLKDYGFDMVSQNNRLYVSLSVINSTIFPIFISGFSYNGKDFFTDAFLRRNDLSVYARSGDYNFSWPLASSECPTAFKKVANKVEKEEYRFEGLSGERDDREDLITMSLFKDGTGTLNGSGGSMIHKAMKWTLEDDVIKMITAQTPYESSDLDDALGDLTDVWINTKKTNYGLKMRSEKMTEENYHELCLSFDLTYGLKKDKNITSFDKYFEEKHLKDRLLNKDVTVYEDAFVELIYKHIDDIHSGMRGGESVYSPSDNRSFISNKTSEYKGDRNKNYYKEVTELGLLRNDADAITPYIIEGDTAYLRFGLFTHAPSSTFPINHKDYKTSSHEEAVSAYSLAVGNNPYKAFAIAFNDFTKMENIKNVVIDVAGNIGGEIRCMPYLIAFMTLDPVIVVENQMDDSLVEYHYKVDLNGDGVFGGSGDSFEGKYNFYILNGANFSAGNEISVIAKNTGFAKNLGRKSSGGACAIANRTDITGLTYQLSSIYKMMLKDGDKYISNDNGVSPDLTLPFDNMFDLKKLDAYFKTL